MSFAKVLIVDDDSDHRKLVGIMLQRRGYAVVTAQAGSLALAQAATEHPDLIILNVTLPDINGYEVCRRLRANPDTQAIPIILFSGRSQASDEAAGREAGADAYLTKPMHPSELEAQVKAVLAAGPHASANHVSSASQAEVPHAADDDTAPVADALPPTAANGSRADRMAAALVKDDWLGLTTLLMLAEAGSASLADLSRLFQSEGLALDKLPAALNLLKSAELASLRGGAVTLTEAGQRVAHSLLFSTHGMR